MKKRIISVFMAIVMLFTVSTSVFAMDGNSGNIAVTAEGYSTFTINIPSTFDLTQSDKCEISISNANIADGYVINVLATNLDANGYLELSHETSSTDFAYCSFTNPQTFDTLSQSNNILYTFYPNKIVNGNSSGYFTGELAYCDAVGTYHGNMTYTVECVPEVN